MQTNETHCGYTVTLLNHQYPNYYRRVIFCSNILVTIKATFGEGPRDSIVLNKYVKHAYHQYRCRMIFCNNFLDSRPHQGDLWQGSKRPREGMTPLLTHLPFNQVLLLLSVPLSIQIC